MDAAVDAVFAPRASDRGETGPVPHRMSEAEHHAGTVRVSADALACTKAICNYIYDTYGRFPGGTVRSTSSRVRTASAIPGKSHTSRT